LELDLGSGNTLQEFPLGAFFLAKMGDVTWFHISFAGFSINQDVINPMNIEKLRFNKFNAPKTTFVGNSFHSFLINSNKHIQQQPLDNGIQITFQSFNKFPSILYN